MKARIDDAVQGGQWLNDATDIPDLRPERDVQMRNTVVHIWVWKARTRMRTVPEEMSEE